MYSKTFCSLHTTIPPSLCLSPCSFLRLCHYLCLSLSIHTPTPLPMITPLSVPMPVPHAHAYAHASCPMPLPMPMIYCLSPLNILSVESFVNHNSTLTIQYEIIYYLLWLNMFSHFVFMIQSLANYTHACL